MKAIIARAPGGPEQLEYGDWPDPMLGPGEVLIKVGAAACNRSDVWLRRGLLAPLPMIPGMDAAGTVADKADDVPGLPVGTRVLLNPAVTCDACEYCYSGEHGLCPQRKALGQFLNGTFAQYVKIPWRNVHPIRDDLSFVEAAAIPSAFFTAWQLLVPRARIAPAETALIMAAGSGVGSAAVQLGKQLGARIIAAAGSDSKLERARQLGADDTINYTDGSWPQQVLELTGGRGADVIIDAVGGAFWKGYLECIRIGGRIVACSYTTGRTLEIEIDTLMRRQISIIGSGGLGSKSAAQKIVRLLNEGRIHAVVHKVLPLQDAATAQEAMEDRSVFGKIVLVPDQTGRDEAG